MARYRDVIECQSENHRTLTSYVLNDDGQWQRIMMARYQRTE